MKYTINSRVLGKKVTFSVPGALYIYADLNGQPGTLGNQICRGGYLTGDTLMADGDDYDGFVRICRKWYRAYIRGGVANA